MGSCGTGNEIDEDMPMFRASLYAATNQRRPADTRSITSGRRILPHDYVSDDTVGSDLLIVKHAVEDVAPVHSKAFLFRTPPKPAFPRLFHAHITAACFGAVRSGIGHSLKFFASKLGPKRPRDILQAASG